MALAYLLLPMKCRNRNIWDLDPPFQPLKQYESAHLYTLDHKRFDDPHSNHGRGTGALQQTISQIYDQPISFLLGTNVGIGPAIKETLASASNGMTSGVHEKKISSSSLERGCILKPRKNVCSGVERIREIIISNDFITTQHVTYYERTWKELESTVCP